MRPWLDRPRLFEILYLAPWEHSSGVWQLGLGRVCWTIVLDYLVIYFDTAIWKFSNITIIRFKKYKIFDSNDLYQTKVLFPSTAFLISDIHIIHHCVNQATKHERLGRINAWNKRVKQPQHFSEPLANGDKMSFVLKYGVWLTLTGLDRVKLFS